MIIQVLVALAGVVLIARTVLSAVRTFVVPRGVNDRLTRVAFVVIRKGFTLAAPPSRPYAARDRVMAYYGPIALMLLPAWWLVLILVGFGAIYWALGLPVADALEVSGSSLLTLGFFRPAVAVRGLHRVRRGGDGPRPGGPADLVPAHDLRRLLAARAAREHAGGPRGHAAVAGGDADAHAPSPRSGRAAPDVGALGAVVRRGGGVAQLAAGPRLLPQPAAEPVLGERGRSDHGRGRPRAIRGRHPDGRAGGPRHPLRVPRAPPDLRLLPDPLRRRAEAHGCDEHRPGALRARRSTSSPRRACRWWTTATRHGATSTGGA